MGVAAITACLPYVALKVAWLAGSSAGSATAAGRADLHDVRHTVGNGVTLGMEIVAMMLALAFTHRRGQKLPAAVLLLPVWVGTGLLAPIAPDGGCGREGLARLDPPPSACATQRLSRHVPLLDGGAR